MRPFFSTIYSKASRHPVITALFLVASFGQYSMILQFNSNFFLLKWGLSLDGALGALGVLALYALVFTILVPFGLWWLICWAFD